MGALPKSFVPDDTDQIYQDLSDSLDQWAAQSALFEKVGMNGNMWEHLRKIELAETKERLRKDFIDRNEKVTDGRIEDLAHCAPAYKQFVYKGLAQKEEYHRVHGARINYYVRLREHENKRTR